MKKYLYGSLPNFHPLSHAFVMVHVRQTWLIVKMNFAAFSSIWSWKATRFPYLFLDDKSNSRTLNTTPERFFLERLCSKLYFSYIKMSLRQRVQGLCILWNYFHSFCSLWKFFELWDNRTKEFTFLPPVVILVLKYLV